ncbi:alpha-glucan family phosphorylase [Saccharicrinis aurantiacus]|uniref:alpha-glucan family phosphorylase n=1 Tax=Saccharicrinis aurantiacus TaxID=1849719 RepID=UPI00094F547B|nr:alpha-glucan family phosphorylase [Saccharicrinis aurantiacus]
MTTDYKSPDYIFESSWEVCNKIGGIHTVLASKASTLVNTFHDQIIFIGPDILDNTSSQKEFSDDASLFPEWRNQLLKEGLRVKIGRWNIEGTPIVLLVDFSSFIPQKNEILSRFWETYQLDSISGNWDYVESVIFGYAIAKTIESFYKCYLNQTNKVVAHFNEWMTGSGILYLKNTLPQIATIFTAHATVMGRSIAGNGGALYNDTDPINIDVVAQEIGVVSKHSLEKKSAINADCFTTVSEITAVECERFIDRKVDVVAPNGFNNLIIPNKPDFAKKRKDTRLKLKEISEALLGYPISDNALFIANSGRYEFRNKGTDILLDSLKKLNETESYDRETIVFVLIPANNFGAREDLVGKLNGTNTSKLDNPFLTHGLNDLGYDPILNKIQDIHLNNDLTDTIKLIFVPSYLDGNDGIFNMHYYDLLIGMDISIFPSYYEPWGYTPLESLAYSIPTITTSLAGFGTWAKGQCEDIDDGVAVIERNDKNYDNASKAIVDVIIDFAHKSPVELELIKVKAFQLSSKLQWNLMIGNYYKAYDTALTKVEDRKDSFSTIKREKRIHLTPESSSFPIWKRLSVKSKLPEKLNGLQEIAHNLWWTWNYEAYDLFESIDPKLWIKQNKSPIKLLELVNYDHLVELSEQDDFYNRFIFVHKKFRNYMDRPKIEDPSIAYFSMEYGLNDILKIYSGGLGVLAGDYLKEASDSNVNITAVGLLYRHGYFRQSLGPNGDQQANFDKQEFSNLPLTLIKNEDNSPHILELNAPGRNVFAKVWKADVGRVPLYLLDTDVEQNSDSDKLITHSLYGGDWENRLKQEILLGMGGIKLLDKLNIKTNLYHCNEGHAALINVSRLKKLVDQNFSFNEALELVRASSLFTTHTPVPAGHDKFDEDLIRVYFRNIPEKLNISWNEFMALGRENGDDHSEKFSMSVLAAKTSQEINGVSCLHGKVSRQMFEGLWKGFFPEESPIYYVTNGVHYGTWTSPDIQKLYDKVFDPRFKTDLSNNELWRKIHEVEDEDIWATRTKLRKKLLKFVKKRIQDNMVNSHAAPSEVIEVKDLIKNNALTIGFARRFATYKRAHLLFTDEARLSAIVNNPNKPVQFIFAGKAHPADGGGQALIKQIVQISKKPEFLGKIIFLENYDMELAKSLVSGVDVWLNTPTRPLEASGTSGEKAELNGVLNFSVLDGWWYEGYKEEAGWCLSDVKTYNDQEVQNQLDAANIYSIFENEIIPLFYNQNEKGIPSGWVKYMKNSISEIAPTYTTKRMIDDYLIRFYRKMDQRLKTLTSNDYQKAKELTHWKRRVKANWNDIEVVNVELPDIYSQQLDIGDTYDINLIIDMKTLADTNLLVEAVFADVKDNGEAKIIKIQEFVLERTQDSKRFYTLSHTLNIPGVYDFGIRILPQNEDMVYQQDISCIKWI